MAHAIIFTAQAPRSYNFDGLGYESSYYSYPAGAYKLASHLRGLGLDVLVVPSSLNFTFKGIKRIIEQNSKDLLWVGISTTFLSTASSKFDDYRQVWTNSDKDMISIDLLSDTIQDHTAVTELVWGTAEIWRLSSFLESKYRVPLLVGGAWVTGARNGNLKFIHKNCHIVTGYAEKFIEDFTVSRLNDHTANVPYLVSNDNYDSEGFKQSTIDWTAKDLVDTSAWLPLEVARGCAFNCAYCTYEHKNSVDMFKDTKILRDELIRNYEVHGIDKYYLIDDLYNDSKRKVRVLYDEVWSRLPFKVEWASFMRLDLIWSDPESAELIKASGAKIGSFGIETLHDRAGRKVGKGLGQERIIETLENLKKVWANDVLIHAFFIAGLPDEPKESIEATMAWTESTDLLYSVTWAPLWITPPDHKTFVLEQNMNAITKDNDKYGIDWISANNWINKQGVTFAEVSKMCTDFYHNSTRSCPHGIRISFTDYANLRTAGMTHDDIVELKGMTDSRGKINSFLENVREKIDRRLHLVLELKD